MTFVDSTTRARKKVAGPEGSAGDPRAALDMLMGAEPEGVLAMATRNREARAGGGGSGIDAALMAASGKGVGRGAGFDPLEDNFEGRLRRFVAESPGLALNSGFRSVAHQAALYAQAVKKYGVQGARRWVAPPGRSMHNQGLAADLRFLSPSARQWAHQNAARYGLRFPMAHEPWHVEPANARRR